MSKRKPSARNLRRSASAHQPAPRSFPINNNPYTPYVSTRQARNPQLQVYADAVCRTRHGAEFGGYGIYAPLHSVRIAEPLPGSAQTPERAELRALHAALELVHGVRARGAVVHIHSAYVVDIFRDRLREWEANEWRTATGRFVRNRRLWKDVSLLKRVFADRGVYIDVRPRARRFDQDMRIAYKLAKHGAALHVTCDLCKKTHGRQFTNHACQPICTLDQCNGRVMKNIQAYSRHLYRRHRRVCNRDDCRMGFECFSQQELDEHEREVHGVDSLSCEFCGKRYANPRRLKRHVKFRCRYAPYCVDCGRRFKSRREFERHRAQKHSEESSSDSEEDEEEEMFQGKRFGLQARYDEDEDEDSESDESSTESDESDDDDEDPTGLVLTDKQGREWEIDEYGLRKRRGQSMSEGYVPYDPGFYP